MQPISAREDLKWSACFGDKIYQFFGGISFMLSRIKGNLKLSRARRFSDQTDCSPFTSDS